VGKFLITRAEVVGHLFDAIEQRKRWIFVTDAEQGHRDFVALALAIEVLCGEADLACGFVEWRNWPTNHHCNVSFLTVPKDKLFAEDVKRLVELWGESLPVTEETDLIVRARNVEAMTSFLEAMRSKNIVGEG
jgi:hypothetical protein